MRYIRALVGHWMSEFTLFYEPYDTVKWGGILKKITFNPVDHQDYVTLAVNERDGREATVKEIVLSPLNIQYAHATYAPNLDSLFTSDEIHEITKGQGREETIYTAKFKNGDTLRYKKLAESGAYIVAERVGKDDKPLQPDPFYIFYRQNIV